MTTRITVPFLDLVAPHAALRDELESVFRNALEKAAFIGGPAVEQFEKEFAQYCGVSHCIGVGSGTDAVRFALMAAGVRPEDIVLTVPNTFIATTEAISQAGAEPDFVDVDPRTYNMDAEKLREYIETQCDIDVVTGRPIHLATRRMVSAIVPVHLYGQPANIDALLALAERYQLMVVEDACQAHGASYFSERDRRWHKAGSMGAAAAFSFYPGKNLGACGEAGAVTTNDPEVARTIRVLRDHGQAQKYYHNMEGYNGRLDAIQAAILRIKLAHLDEWNRARREHARLYTELFADLADRLTVPFEPKWTEAVYHLYVIRTTGRDKLREQLENAGIGTGIHYPIPLHLQRAYSYRGFKSGDFPVTEMAASQVVSLPMYPQLQPDQIVRVVESLYEILQRAEFFVEPIAA